MLELRTKHSVFAIGKDGKENEEDRADANTVLKRRAALLIKIIINKALCSVSDEKNVEKWRKTSEEKPNQE